MKKYFVNGKQISETEAILWRIRDCSRAKTLQTGQVFNL